MPKRKKKDPFKPQVELPTPKVTVFGKPAPADTISPGQADDNVWNSEKVEAILRKADEEGLDFKKIPNPFFDANPEFKAPNIIWEYTPEELDEIKKCSKDAVYFSRYCQVMTDEGLAYINLRDYQEDIIRTYQDNRFSIFLAPRQIGKCFLRNSYVSSKSLKSIQLGRLLPKKTGFLPVIKSILFRIYSLL
jgi:hypothetical protein